ncbi:MAG: metal-dependent transcriptional regulator [Candidatus Micrarchaeota archaeon]
MAEKLTPEAEEYLETLARMKELDKEPTVSELASALSVSKASVSQMLGKMAQKGLVRYQRYGEISLTQRGAAEGARVLRKHRLIERFLAFIGLRRHVHEEACILEHAVSDQVEKQMRNAMRNAHPAAVPLTSLGSGESASVAIVDAGAKASQRLADMGLTKGTRITLLKAAPFKGPVKILVRDTTLALGRSVAGRIFVEVAR